MCLVEDERVMVLPIDAIEMREVVVCELHASVLGDILVVGN